MKLEISGCDIQWSIRALVDSFAPVSVPGCFLHAHARQTTCGDVKKYQQTYRDEQVELMVLTRKILKWIRILNRVWHVFLGG
jgi:hypothetical protein